MLIVVTAGPCPNYLSFDAPHCYSWPSWSASPTWFLCKCGHIPTPQTRGQSGGSCHGWRLKHVAICSGKHGRLKTFGIQSTSGSKIKMSSLFFLGSRWLRVGWFTQKCDWIQTAFLHSCFVQFQLQVRCCNRIVSETKGPWNWVLCQHVLIKTQCITSFFQPR